ncbi:2'-5' RNA ligase family protein [Actinocorallia populi]|uniref:2'-5' RNA ligase family protein n=1 Tax=Actinocorallia populi TaxID=2079200 RepID=UPI000D08667D|nr:2'-5' RNA ligase family protein [Actinocorallia populi]
MADEPTPYRTGTTALIVAVPEAEPVVARWRHRYDHAAAAGARAHVTVLFPFLDANRIDATVVSELAQMFARHQKFTARFRRTARRPSILYLPAEPADRFSRLTKDVVARWPDCPPYGGKYPGTVPHLTVAIRRPDLILDQVDRGLTDHLPLTAAITSVDLVAFEGRSWHRHHSFELGRRAW